MNVMESFGGTRLSVKTIYSFTSRDGRLPPDYAGLFFASLFGVGSTELPYTWVSTYKNNIKIEFPGLENTYIQKSKKTLLPRVPNPRPLTPGPTTLTTRP